MVPVLVESVEPVMGSALIWPFEYSQESRGRAVELGHSSTAGSYFEKEVEETAVSGVSEPTSEVCKPSAEGERKKRSDQSLLVPMSGVLMSNFNGTVLAAALVLMVEDPVWQEAASDRSMKSSLKMLYYLGAVVGQLLMGYIGDVAGRRNGMIITLGLVILGAFSSAACSWGPPYTALGIMCVWRLVLGMGSGGTYPLAAVSASEGTVSADNRSPRVAWVYAINVPGMTLPYVLGLVLYVTCKSSEVAWRLLIGAGCLPALVVFSSALRMKDAEEYENVKYKNKLWQALCRREHLAKLVGTGVAWLVYDIACYGVLLIQPEMLRQIFSGDVTTTTLLWQGALLNACGIPGVIAGVLVIRQMTLKGLQFWGFALVAVVTFALSIAVQCSAAPWVQMALLCLINYFINWGAAISTFVLPQEIFPAECRSTYNGIAAALGKVGAVIGIWTFEATQAKYGVALTMILAGITSIVGCILTLYFVPPFPRDRTTKVFQIFAWLAAAIPYCDLRTTFGLQKYC